MMNQGNSQKPGQSRIKLWPVFVVIIAIVIAGALILWSRPAPSPVPAPLPSDTPAPGTPTAPVAPTNTPSIQPQPTATVSTPLSPPFNYAEALQKSLYFYEAQRSGPLPANNRVEWRGDSALEDGADNGVDLTGGWYDAGDAIKFGFPMAASATMLAWGIIEYRDAYSDTGQLEYALDNIRWATDYFMKAHTAPNVLWGQVGDGNIDHDWWGPAEVMTMPRPSFKIDENCPGSDLAGETAAALAAASIVFKPTDPAYADQLLEHAIQLYAFADLFRGKYSDCIQPEQGYYTSYSGYWDELVWGALWLHRATNNEEYLEKAEDYYTRLDEDYTHTQTWDDKRYGSNVLLALVTGKTGYAKVAEQWLDYWTIGYNDKRIKYTPGGLAWGGEWGVLRLAANTAFIAFVYSDNITDTVKKARYHDFAARQIDYMLGDNPRKSSYVVGFGYNPPTQPSHRNAHGSWAGKLRVPAHTRHTLYGALIGGPDENDQFVNTREDYRTNEAATDYNAAFTGALARMVLEFGGKVLEDFPPPEPRTDEFFVEASVHRMRANMIEVRAFLNNRSAWPPRISIDLSFRYFIDLGEVLTAGHSVDEVKVQLTSADGARLSPLRPWPGSSNLFFVEVDFSGIPIFPGGEGHYRKEARLTIILPETGLRASMGMNSTSQWSLQNLTGAVTKTLYIPVYEGERHLFGQEPAARGSLRQPASQP